MVLSQGDAWQPLEAEGEEGEESSFYHPSSRSICSSDTASPIRLHLPCTFPLVCGPFGTTLVTTRLGNTASTTKCSFLFQRTINFSPVPADSLETFKQQLVLACLCKHLQHAGLVAQIFFSGGFPWSLVSSKPPLLGAVPSSSATPSV